MQQDKLNLLITGVGGQGTIVASLIVATAATRLGLSVAVGETYGASQRGGSVMSHVKLGRGPVGGPLIPLGRADVVVGFEPAETLRVMADYANSSATVVLNPRPLYPVGVMAGGSTYPEVDQIVAHIRGLARRVLVVEAVELARQAGDALAQNIVLVGCLDGLGLLPIDTGTFAATIADIFAQRRPEVNLRAFQLGRQAILGQIS